MASTIVLITGANSGVGYATSKILAEASPNYHIIMASRSLPKLDAALSELSFLSTIKGTLSALQLDVIDQNSISAAAAQVEQSYGHIDVLINNAAIGCRDPDLAKRLRISLETNAIGPALVSAAFRPLLLKSKNPYSFYVSSGQGSLERASTETAQLLSNAEAYRTSKAAMNMIALNEKIEYAGKGLKVFVACPGFVRSNLRGTGEDARSGWGKAGDPEVSGRMVLDIVSGKRDGDVGKFVWTNGTYPW